jgi:GT2 family glycosyltransferase
MLDRLDEQNQAGHALASIIIPCYLLPDKGNELERFTANCLGSIQEYLSHPYEIIIVDNGSEIGTKMLREGADLYIRNEENLGYGPAVNQGLAAASGDWLIVCNNDVEFVHDWIQKAVDAWHEDTGIISSHLLDHDPAMRVGREVPPTFGYFMGALWMISREVYEEIGGLDEQFEYGMFEDKSYVLSIQATGREFVKVGHCKHVGNATWGKLENQDEIYLANKQRFEAKWAATLQTS